MSDRDEDLQHQLDRAARALEARLRPWVDGLMADLPGFCREFIEDMHAQGWWPHPRPPDKPGRYVPANEEFREALAEIKGDHP